MTDLASAPRGEPEPVKVPFVEVVRGDPDEDELAALVAGLVAARSAAILPDAAPPAAPWNSLERRLRRAGELPAVGPDAWRWGSR